jgi:hypothetical protein
MTIFQYVYMRLNDLSWTRVKKSYTPMTGPNARIPVDQAKVKLVTETDVVSFDGLPDAVRHEYLNTGKHVISSKPSKQGSGQ